MTPNPRSLTLAAAALLAVSAAPAAAETFETKAGPVSADIVAEGLEHPWAVAFLPDGAMLVTERPGRLRIVSGGALSPPVEGVPEVHARGQGGLLDVVLDPAFGENGLVYLSYAEAGEGGAGTAVARGRLVREGDTPRLADVAVIFRQKPKVSGNGHFGSRLVFAPDGLLFVTLGERQKKTPAQDLMQHLGKIVRIAPDGAVPADNPFVGRADALPEIWSYGHRNPQSIAIEPGTGRLFEVEHGARGGDEVNLPEAGRNYGWPEISYGVNYDGSAIGVGTEAEGMEQPVHVWDPSIAPSGAAFYDADALPFWRGDLFVGALKSQLLVRLDVEDGRIVGEERLFEGRFGRIRDVRQGPDGALYMVTDSGDGAVIRIGPAEAGTAG
ncbi:PQQ-dependent sugar dehydrogenase [Prosthecomicrobium pneumaticum]|uniref:Glucose/arabinose dehydrogenase n=1 Tax=Prosthecomicrobium pneumaticum TaxID=81895 RepID=A0A7W9FLF3_9HYPH|nr:PQQ-dependent sugar dehydrogenase [Prosthecomicrobium pneumaticum]MBB5752821.1 glucose/arabinose dehydrogenase [Prosthecomicrobium pneumaticum]